MSDGCRCNGDRVAMGDREFVILMAIILAAAGALMWVG